MNLARAAPSFLNHTFPKAFWSSWRQRTGLCPSLVRSGHNHRSCELYGVLKHAFSEFWVSERHRGLNT